MEGDVVGLAVVRILYLCCGYGQYAAESSIRSGSPLAIRECCVSSATASRMVSCAGMPRCVLVSSAPPVVRVRALRADVCARGGTGRSSERSLTVTDPRGPRAPVSAADPGERGPLRRAPANAGKAFGQAIDSLPKGYHRDRGIYLVRKAAHAGAGEPEQGAETGMQALVIGAETNSARIINGLARLNRTLSRRNTVPRVVEFRHALTDVRFTERTGRPSKEENG
jgi:hypothetical protein